MKVDKKGYIRYKGWFESDEDYNKRIIAKRLEKNELYRRYRYWRKVNDKNIAAVTARQDIERDKQKKLMKRYEDFLKLINFVNYIENETYTVTYTDGSTTKTITMSSILPGTVA